MNLTLVIVLIVMLYMSEPDGSEETPEETPEEVVPEEPVNPFANIAIANKITANPRPRGTYLSDRRESCFLWFPGI